MADHPSILQQLQCQRLHLLVDEFQDSNKPQVIAVRHCLCAFCWEQWCPIWTHFSACSHTPTHPPTYPPIPFNALLCADGSGEPAARQAADVTVVGDDAQSIFRFRGLPPHHPPPPTPPRPTHPHPTPPRCTVAQRAPTHPLPTPPLQRAVVCRRIWWICCKGSCRVSQWLVMTPRAFTGSGVHSPACSRPIRCVCWWLAG